MNIGIDPIAYLLALATAWIAIIEFWRSNNIIIRVVKADAFSEISISGGECHVLRVIVRNLGIPLHNVTLKIGFRGPGGSGWMSVPLQQQGMAYTGSSSEFAKGMIAEYGMQTSRTSLPDLATLCCLANPIEQEAKLLIYSQGYLAKTFKIGWGGDRLKLRWNEFAGRLNPFWNSTKRNTITGNPIIKWGKVIPTIPQFSVAVNEFISLVKPGLPPQFRPVLNGDRPFCK